MGKEWNGMEFSVMDNGEWIKWDHVCTFFNVQVTFGVYRLCFDGDEALCWWYGFKTQFVVRGLGYTMMMKSQMS